MKFLFLVFKILIILSIAADGQPVPKESKFYISAYGSPDLGYRLLNNNDETEIADIIIEQRNNIEGPKIGYTAGFSAGYLISSKISLEAGIQFRNRGYNIKKQDDLYFGDFVDPRYNYVYQTGNITASEIESIKFASVFKYLEIPVSLNLRYGKKKVSFISSFGIAPGYLVESSQVSIIQYKNGDSERNKNKSAFNYKNYNITVFVSSGINYQLLNNIRLSAYPIFRYGLLKIIDAPITGYLYDGGFVFAVHYTL